MSLKQILFTLCLGVFFILILPHPQQAQQGPITVSGIKFNKEKFGGLLDDWIEVEVKIEGGFNSDERAYNRSFVDDVKVLLILCYQIRSGREPSLRFFQAEVTIAAVKQGKDCTLYFYLPPEVIERDRLPSEPYAYLVELKVGGEALPTRHEHVSSSLRDAARVATFKSRAAAAAEENAGILLPIYHTPFYTLFDKLKKSPSYVRKPVK